jgi:hypothetical protein
MQLKSRKRHPYGGKYRNPGDIYEAKDSHAKALILCKQAEKYDAPAPKPEPVKAPEKATIDNKAITADDKPRRGRPPKYQTRAMVADSD